MDRRGHGGDQLRVTTIIYQSGVTITHQHGGDTGYTDLLGGRQVAKYDPLIEALGALDEATSALGVARQGVQRPQAEAVLRQAQRDLYQLMAELSIPPDHPQRVRVTTDRVQWVEHTLAQLTAAVSIPARFCAAGRVRGVGWRGLRPCGGAPGGTAGGGGRPRRGGAQSAPAGLHQPALAAALHGGAGGRRGGRRGF